MPEVPTDAKRTAMEPQAKVFLRKVAWAWGLRPAVPKRLNREPMQTVPVLASPQPRACRWLPTLFPAGKAQRLMSMECSVL